MDLSYYRTHKARKDAEEEKRWQGEAPLWDDIDNEWFCPNLQCGNVVQYDEDKCRLCEIRLDWDKIIE